MTDENTTNEAKLYELGFHVNPAINDDQISKKIDEIKAVLTKNGAEIVKEGEPQAMKLVYEITKSIAGKNERFTTSTFAWIKFNSTAEGIESIKEEIELDTKITYELREEGLLRELIRIIQNLRQDAGLESKDEIVLMLQVPSELEKIIQKQERLIKKEINASLIEYKRSDKFKVELETKIDAEPIWLALRKITLV